MTVKSIIEKYLRDNGYDGLYSDDYECGCEVDDLMPCEEPGIECRPGYKGPCLAADCEYGGECDFHIGLEKK